MLINDLYYTRTAHGKPWSFKKSQFRKLEVPPQVLSSRPYRQDSHTPAAGRTRSSCMRWNAHENARGFNFGCINPNPRNEQQAVVELLQKEHGCAGASLHTLEFGLVAVIGTKR